MAHPYQVGGPFDVVVATFALLNRGLIPLLRSLALVMNPAGALIIQILHPSNMPPPYVDGWRKEDFSDFGGDSVRQAGVNSGVFEVTADHAAWVVIWWGAASMVGGGKP